MSYTVTALALPDKLLLFLWVILLLDIPSHLGI